MVITDCILLADLVTEMEFFAHNDLAGESEISVVTERLFSFATLVMHTLFLSLFPNDPRATLWKC